MPDASFLILYFALFAFLGWIVECVFYFVVEKELVNRGFLYGPFVPLYGFGALFTLAVSHYSQSLHISINIVLCTLLVTVMEYVSSFILEKYYSLRLWDYSDEKLNIFPE